MKKGEQELSAVRAMLADRVFETLERMVSPDESYPWNRVSDLLIGASIVAPVVPNGGRRFREFLDRALAHRSEQVRAGALSAMQTTLRPSEATRKLVDLVRADVAVSDAALEKLEKGDLSLSTLVELVGDDSETTRARSHAVLARVVRRAEIPAVASSDVRRLWGVLDAVPSSERESFAETLGLLGGMAVLAELRKRSAREGLHVAGRPPSEQLGHLVLHFLAAEDSVHATAAFAALVREGALDPAFRDRVFLHDHASPRLRDVATALTLDAPSTFKADTHEALKMNIDEVRRLGEDLRYWCLDPNTAQRTHGESMQDVGFWMRFAYNVEPSVEAEVAAAARDELLTTVETVGIGPSLPSWVVEFIAKGIERDERSQHDDEALRLFDAAMTKISHAVDGGSEISVDTSLLLAVGRALVVAVEGRSYLELG